MLILELKANRLPAIAAGLHSTVESRLEHLATGFAGDWSKRVPVGPNRPHPSGKGNYPHYRDRIMVLPNPDGNGFIIFAAGIAYDVFLEYGTWKMAARPSFTPTLEQLRGRFSDEMTQAILSLVAA